MSIFFLLGAACIADGIYEISKKVKKEAEIRIECTKKRMEYNRRRYHKRVWN